MDMRWNERVLTALTSTSLGIFASAWLGAPAWSQHKAAEPDITKQPTLYVVGYAHLDTQWRWTYPQTIREFLAHTLHDNFKLLEQHPDYVFNFTGSRRYQMFKEYYPAEYEELKRWIAAGRWFPCGSSVDENDSNMPSAESLVRHVLYGNRFFRREFGVASDEYMLPDCFGFPASLPSVLAHCGVRGFSTQKLTWNAVVPIPFNVGYWEGPDGRGVTAALNPGQYDGDVTENLATSETWKKRIEADGERSGVFADYHYYGTGDVGGAPKEASVAMVEQSLATKGPVHVNAGHADALFDAITPEMQKRLPKYKGELELTEHSAGSLTSQAFMKCINRKNEFLADEAERASVSAAWLGGRAYPSEKLERAWTLVLGSQMHDIISGTALAKGYEYAWNDELIAANQFSAVLTDAASVVAGQMDTNSPGKALVVFNPLSVEREDVVEADVRVDESTAHAAKGVSVRGADGKTIPAQILRASSDSVRIAFLAKLPQVAFAVYDVQITPNADSVQTALRIDEHSLENERYLVKIDGNGDVASIFDKKAKREMLSAPARLGLHYENPKNWPAWNQDWTDRQKPASEFVAGPVQSLIVERGPARVALEITRALGASTFTQRIRLCAGGAGDRVELDNDIAWGTRERSLRAEFPLTVANPIASYDIQTGVLERGNAHAKQYEYGSHQWFDLTDAKGDYGVSVMNDCKYGSDKPDDHTLRLTLLHTPGTRGGYQDQGTQDLGRHHVLYALSGHAGDWREGKSAVEASRLNQPLISFQSLHHSGSLGKSFELAQISSDAVRVQAIKKAEDSDEIVVRLRELSGHAAKNVRLSAVAPITSAREVDGQERTIDAKSPDATTSSVHDGALVFDIQGFGLRAFAIKLGAPPTKASAPESIAIALPFDTDVVSTNANRADGAMNKDGDTFPAEQLPSTIVAEEATFTLGPVADGHMNAVTCRGQEIRLPLGALDRVYLLAASARAAKEERKDDHAPMHVDERAISVRVPNWSGYVGQWDHRSWQGDVPEQAYGWSNGLAGLEPGYVETTPIAWFASHHHTPSGDAPYEYCYLYKIAIDLPPGAQTIRLPNDERIRVLAATAIRSEHDEFRSATTLVDTMSDHAQDAPRILPEGGKLTDAVDVRIEPTLYWRAGAIRFTRDGSEPSASSPAFANAFSLNHTETIRAAVMSDAGVMGPSTSRKIEVDDVTPPTVKQATPAYGSPLVRVVFSEPVGDSALSPQSYALDPIIAVRTVKRGANDREVIVELEKPLVLDETYHLKISGVKDESPAHNAMKAAVIELAIKGPVFTLTEVKPEQMGSTIRDVAGLPIKAKDAWTMNMFVRTDAQPEDRTLIAGFGRCEQTSEGVARYMAKFSRGIHFWSHNRDVEGRTPLDLGRWQMLTATYDSRVLCVYKDGKKLAQRELELADDENAVHIAPIDPWDQTRRFKGEIRDLTIWSEALSVDAIGSLKSASTLH
jgi:alpha-mannosidase